MKVWNSTAMKFSAVITCAVIAASAVSGMAMAQSVPKPKSRPATTVTPPAPILPPAAASARAQAAPTNPFAALLGKGSATNGTLDTNQRAIIDRVSNYLSGIRMLTGKFVQVGPDGRRTEGELYIQKPGKMRFEYDAPSPIEIVSDGDSVVVRDRNLATQDVYPLSQTPLRFLLADRLDLLRDTNLVAVYADDTYITVVVEETHGIVGKSRMMIMFNASDTQLKQWTVTDPQGYDTTVAVYNLDATKRPDPNLFKIDFTAYRN